jgi:hypothetical protein
MSLLKRLTGDIKRRDLQKESERVTNKWEKTGLLEGLQTDTGRYGVDRSRMARLLENQAAELLREASSMQAGDVEGFASVAFPIVRRVFGSLIANDLVAVQPMSLPAGLIFFLDFTKTDTRLGDTADDSLYGGAVVGRQLTGGVDLSQAGGAETGFYGMNNGYASPVSQSLTVQPTVIASGTIGSDTFGTAGGGGTADPTVVANQNDFDSLAQWDPDLSGSGAVLVSVPAASFPNLNETNLVTLTLTSSIASGATQVRRLTQYATDASGNKDKSTIYMWFAASSSVDAAVNTLSGNFDAGDTHDFQYAVADNFQNGNALGSVVGGVPWALESQAQSADGTFTEDITGDIPEIDIKVDSISVTAITKKLKAKWTPELGQDLNAFHNMDAEVELTNILSEQIGLEIDREILVDLIKEATAGTLYWSRRPGKFVNSETGTDVSSATAPPDFTGNVSEWYETLLETVNDLSARIHRKTLQGGANFMVVSPEVASILEMTNGFRASVAVDDDRGTAASLKAGTLNNRWDVYVDPYFYRNLMLVGRKGNSFLESGYVYAPYVPLQVTPTIFGPEDFVPRKGVMTRYAKKMVRPDYYGLVIIQDFLG